MEPVDEAGQTPWSRPTLRAGRIIPATRWGGQTYRVDSVQRGTSGVFTDDPNRWPGGGGDS
jgi:hypothetical protein